MEIQTRVLSASDASSLETQVNDALKTNMFPLGPLLCANSTWVQVVRTYDPENTALVMWKFFIASNLFKPLNKRKLVQNAL